MRSRPEFRFPRSPRRGWGALALAVVIHLALFSIPATDWFWSPEGRPTVVLIPLPADIPPLVFRPQLPPRPQRARRQPPPAVPPAPAPEAAPSPPRAEPAAEPPGVPGAPIDSAAGEPRPEGLGPATVPRLRPSLGAGKLWVQPLPLAPRELAHRLSRSHFELVDSAVSAIVQAYLDSVLTTPSPSNAPPSWTTQIAGKTFGLDARNIYLGPLKIPTAILALLPLPQVSNIDLRNAQQLNDIRADLQYAAQRAATMDEFKRAIREIREQREREREMERNQRKTPADTTRAP